MRLSFSFGGTTSQQQPEFCCAGNLAYLGNVLLADHVLAMLDLLRVSSNEDAPSLAATVRLANVCPVLSHATISLEVPITMQEQNDSVDAANSPPLYLQGSLS